MAEILSLDGIVSVPYGSFAGSVVTKDFSPLERESVQNKWYARGVGLVKSMDIRGGLDTTDLLSVKWR